MDNDLELVTLEEPPELQEKLQPIRGCSNQFSRYLMRPATPSLFPEEQMDELRRAFLKNPRANTSTMLDYLSPVIVRRR
jgi:hypothetical protein